MKKLGFKWVTVLAAGIALFTAASCSSDDGGETKYITKPSLQDRTVKAGETGEVTFTASGNWTINNDAPEWLEFSSSTGGAGEQTISYEVTDLNLAFDIEDTANISLQSDAGTVSCVFTRASKERMATFFDGPLSESEAIIACVVTDLGGDGDFKGRVTIKSNFEWTLESSPEWSEASQTEGLYPVDINNKPIISDEITHTVFFDLTDEALSTTGKDGEAVFSAKANPDFKITLPIKFYGAEPSKVVYDGQFQMKFSSDGFVYDNALVGSNPTDKKEVPFNVKSIPGGYKTVLVGFNNGFGTVMEEGGWPAPWIGIDPAAAPPARAAFEVQYFELWVQDNLPAYPGAPAPAERKAEMYLLPATVYAQFGDINQDLFNPEGSAVADEFQQYLVSLITQEAPKAGIKIEMADGSNLEQTSVDEGTSKFESFYYVVGASAAAPVAIVTLSDELAGRLPQVMKQIIGPETPPQITWVTESTMTTEGDVMTFPLATVDLDGTITNQSDATVTLQNVSGDGKTYELKFNIPANTLDKGRRMLERTISFYDADGALKAEFNIEQQPKL